MDEYSGRYIVYRYCCQANMPDEHACCRRRSPSIALGKPARPALSLWDYEPGHSTSTPTRAPVDQASVHRVESLVGVTLPRVLVDV